MRKKATHRTGMVRRSNNRRKFQGGASHHYDLQKAYPNQGVSPPMSSILSHYQGGSSPALLGDPWRPEPKYWPGVDGVPANRNHFPLNQYGGRSRRKRRSTHKRSTHKRSNHKRSAAYRRSTYRHSINSTRGGGTSNLVAQDLVNLGRQFQHGIGSAYNILSGYPETPSPMPWRDQLARSNV